MPRIQPKRVKSAGATCLPRSAVRSYPRRRAAWIAHALDSPFAEQHGVHQLDAVESGGAELGEDLL
jgi:hypothetical protein